MVPILDVKPSDGKVSVLCRVPLVYACETRVDIDDKIVQIGFLRNMAFWEDPTVDPADLDFEIHHVVNPSFFDSSSFSNDWDNSAIQYGVGSRME